MAETSIQRARRLARERREAQEAAELAEALAAEEATEEPEEEEEGFFSSFFNREDTIDDAVENAQRRQNTDEANK